MANSNLTPSPNVALLDAIQRIWSLKTVDDGTGNQQIVVVPSGLNGSGAAFSPLIGTKSYYLNSGNGGILMPAVAGQRWFITSLVVLLASDSNLGTAGDILVSLLDGATTIEAFNIYEPASVGTARGNIPIFALSGMNLVSGASNQALTVSLSTALASGNLNVWATGGYTTQIP